MYESLVELFEVSCRKYSQRELFGTKIQGGWHWINYAQFKQRVDVGHDKETLIGVKRREELEYTEDGHFGFVPFVKRVDLQRDFLPDEQVIFDRRFFADEDAVALADRPGVQAIWTWNAASNRHMIAVNEKGYFPYTPSTNLLFGLREALTMLLEEGLDLTPIISHRLPLSDYARAFDLVAAGHAGKIVLLPQAE